MRKCPKCNTEITNDKAKYCKKCGTKLPPFEPQTNEEMRMLLSWPMRAYR